MSRPSLAEQSRRAFVAAFGYSPDRGPPGSAALAMPTQSTAPNLLTKRSTTATTVVSPASKRQAVPPPRLATAAPSADALVPVSTQTRTTAERRVADISYRPVAANVAVSHRAQPTLQPLPRDGETDDSLEQFCQYEQPAAGQAAPPL